MATSLRRVEPKENQDPENRLIPGDRFTNRLQEKTEPHTVPHHPRVKSSTPPNFLWDKLLARKLRPARGQIVQEWIEFNQAGGEHN